MSGLQLKQARKARGWTQAEAARRLKVSQAYVSMLERERRSLPDGLRRRAVQTLSLPLTALPFRGEAARRNATEDEFAVQLASLGYPGFAHLKQTPRWNPAELLMAMLARPNLSARLVEAMPWLPRFFPSLDWPWVLQQAKLDGTQNRLGFVVRLAQLLAGNRGDAETVERLQPVLTTLHDGRLAKEDTLCQEDMTQVERRWLREYRNPEAAPWNLLSDLKPEFLDHAV